VRVLNDEGLASRIDPEPCASTREGRREASVGGCTGQPLSRDRHLIRGADDVGLSESNTFERVNASAQTAPRGLRHWHVQKPLTRKPGGLVTDHKTALVRIGEAMS
jgi:hypothetical protein